MLLVFTYWFGVIGWIAFPDKYQFRKSEVVDGSTVQNSVESGWGNNRAVPLQTVWQGMIMVVDQGVRKDDVGEALDKFQWPAPCPNPAEYGCKPCQGPIVTYDCIRDRSETGSAPCLDEGAHGIAERERGMHACIVRKFCCLCACVCSSVVARHNPNSPCLPPSPPSPTTQCTFHSGSPLFPAFVLLSSLLPFVLHWSRRLAVKAGWLPATYRLR